MKYKILLAGIDGSGKTTCLDLLISKLQSQYRIIKIGNCDPYVYYKGKKQLGIKFQSYRILRYLRPISYKYHFHVVFLIINFTYKYLISQYLYLRNKSDLIIYESDILLHPAVYITYFLPMSKNLKNTFRFKIVKQLFRSRKAILIFYLDTAPEVAVERIHKRPIEIQAHENIADLTELKNEFDDMLNVACESGFEIFKINTNDQNQEEVAHEVQGIIEKKFFTPLTECNS